MPQNLFFVFFYFVVLAVERRGQCIMFKEIVDVSILICHLEAFERSSQNSAPVPAFTAVTSFASIHAEESWHGLYGKVAVGAYVHS